MSDFQEENPNQQCQNRFSHTMLSLASFAAVLLAAVLAISLSNKEVESKIISVGTIIALKGDPTTLRKQGWALCDGTTPIQQGISGAALPEPTPNLKSRFLKARFVREPVYMGCYACESSFITFPKKALINHLGGESYLNSLHTAKLSGQRYFATARDGNYGHMFTFDTFDTSRCKVAGGGCENPCKDDSNKLCGCAEGSCGSDETDPEKPRRLRRWAVYSLGKKQCYTDSEDMPGRSLHAHERNESGYEIVYVMLVK